MLITWAFWIRIASLKLQLLQLFIVLCSQNYCANHIKMFMSRNMFVYHTRFFFYKANIVFIIFIVMSNHWLWIAGLEYSYLVCSYHMISTQLQCAEFGCIKWELAKKSFSFLSNSVLKRSSPKQGVASWLVDRSPLVTEPFYYTALNPKLTISASYCNYSD